jgi:hypothetical protein
MLTHRVFFADNGTLTDRSLEARGGGFTATIVAAEDYIYLGQMYPFNSFYVDISSAQANASVLSIEYWEGNTWAAAVDVLDETSSSGVTLAQSGVVRFTTDDEERWQRVQDTSEETSLGDLENATIYDMYWIRMKFSADTTATGISQISYKFTDDDTLSGLDPDIDQYLTNWESGKTNWTEQIILASTQVTIDLKKNGLLDDVAQLLRIDREIELLTAYKTLITIYSGLGGDKFNQKKADTVLTYNDLIGGITVAVDKDGDGLLDRSELNVKVGRPIR